MTRREGGGCGAEGQHQRVPAMGRGTCSEKRRGRGRDAGAEDGEVWPDMVRSDAVNRGGVARPSGGWGEGGQGVRLRFGAHTLFWRYEEAYLFEIIHYCCRSGGGWWRGLCGIQARERRAGGERAG